MASAARVFSGIQPTGVPQLGNYLGSIKNWVALQTQQLQQGRSITPHEQFISIVDLHALTVPRDPEKLRKETIETAASLIACGIDPSRSVLFRQSAVPAHTQVHWVLSCITPVGWLNRMTQWKSKLQQQQQQQETTLDQTALNFRSAAAQNLLTGLFTYPVLMAADILLYRATHVPVGEDQIQHLEFARDLLVHFNKTYKTKLFPMPTPLLTESRRVMSLRDPLRKMSKSDPQEYSRITLADTEDQIVLKIRKASTDSISGITFDPESRPGVSNLLSIYAALCSTSPKAAADVMSNFTNAQLKNTVAEAVVNSLSPIRQQMCRLLEDRGYIESILRKNEVKAREVAEQNWKSIAKCIGLSY